MSAQVTTAKLDALEQTISSRESVHSSKSADFQTNVKLIFSNTSQPQTRRLLHMSQVLNTLHATLSKPHTGPTSKRTVMHSPTGAATHARCNPRTQSRQTEQFSKIGFKSTSQKLSKTPACSRGSLGSPSRANGTPFTWKDTHLWTEVGNGSADEFTLRALRRRRRRFNCERFRRQCRCKRVASRRSAGGTHHLATGDVLVDAGELHALLTWSVQRDERESEVAVGKRASELAACRDEVCKSIFSMRHFVDAMLQRVVGRLCACGWQLCRLTKLGVESVGSARIEIQNTIERAGVFALFLALQRIGGPSMIRADNLGVKQTVQSGEEVRTVPICGNAPTRGMRIMHTWRSSTSQCTQLRRL